jgi:hypothetical protein
MRAPQTGEGGFSGVMRTGAGGPPILRNEHMQIGFDTDGQVARTAVFYITYEIENRGAALDLPIDFLGVAVEKPEIHVNGKDLDFDRRTDRKLQRELIERLFAHRCAFRPNIGHSDDLRRELLDRLRGEGKNIDCEPADRLREKIAQADLGQLKIYDKLDTVSFVAHFVPGRNLVTVAYKQPLFVAEGEYGHGSGFGLHGAALGFDYLLYPARTWTIDPKFTLTVEISLPNPRVAGIIRDSYPKPSWRSNLALTDASPAKELALTYVKGSYSGLPADIFSFWFSIP